MSRGVFGAVCLLITLAMCSGPAWARSARDLPDDTPDGPQIHVIYALPQDGAPLDRGLDVNGQLVKETTVWQRWLEGQTGGKGFRLAPATLPGYNAGRPPRNKGLRYSADPPRVEEIIAVMRQAGERVHGDRVRGLIVVLWRALTVVKRAWRSSLAATTRPSRTSGTHARTRPGYAAGTHP